MAATLARGTDARQIRRVLHPREWLRVRPEGLFCEPGGFFVDPLRAVGLAVVTHGHSDHARGGHGAVLATAETLTIMRARKVAPKCGQALRYGEALRVGDVTVSLQPAGHVLGSAQVVMEYGGSRAVVSGDYKRAPDSTCAPFLPVPCDVFVTEATFGMPVFRFPPAAAEIARLLASVALFPARCHVLGCYALGKAQRLIALLREAGWDRPVYLHPALQPLCALYQAMGVALGDLRKLAGVEGLAGEIVLAPPGFAGGDGGLSDPVSCWASGWMLLSRRARASGAELPLVISDHADWPGLLATMEDVGAPEVWVTHGREDALIHALEAGGIRARALRLVGREAEA